MGDDGKKEGMIHNLQAHFSALQKKGVIPPEADVASFDYEGVVDETLTYAENERLVSEQMGVSSSNPNAEQTAQYRNMKDQDRREYIERFKKESGMTDEQGRPIPEEYRESGDIEQVEYAKRSEGRQTGMAGLVPTPGDKGKYYADKAQPLVAGAAVAIKKSDAALDLLRRAGEAGGRMASSTLQGIRARNDQQRREGRPPFLRPRPSIKETMMGQSTEPFLMQEYMRAKTGRSAGTPSSLLLQTHMRTKAATGGVHPLLQGYAPRQRQVQEGELGGEFRGRKVVSRQQLKGGREVIVMGRSKASSSMAPGRPQFTGAAASIHQGNITGRANMAGPHPLLRKYQRPGEQR